MPLQAANELENQLLNGFTLKERAENLFQKEIKNKKKKKKCFFIIYFLLLFIYLIFYHLTYLPT